MPKPLPTPIANPMSSSKITAHEPIAASDDSPRKCPTITMSAVLYNCWKIFDSNMGNAKTSS